MLCPYWTDIESFFTQQAMEFTPQKKNEIRQRQHAAAAMGWGYFEYGAKSETTHERVGIVHNDSNFGILTIENKKLISATVL